MYEKEEQRLADYKKNYDNMDIPFELLDDAIMTGFQKAQVEKKRKPRRKKWVVSFIAAAILMLGFVTSIRVSPAFAEYITVIPGMEKIVELIRSDKGRMQAIQNDYYESIGVSQEKNGLAFTIDGAIADEKGLVLFYTIQSDEKQKQLVVEDARIEGVDGENIKFGTASFGAPLYSEEGKTTHSSYLEYYFQTPLKERKFHLEVKVKGEKQTETYQFSFKLKKDIQKVKTYPLNQTVTIEGQKITFMDAKVYPLRVEVHVKMDRTNTKKLFNFDDLRLVDEHGETWNKIANGVTASLISDNEAIIYLQSNYFRQPKELYLVMNKIQAVDKEATSVVVDTEIEEILKQPGGEYLSGLKVTDNHLLLTLNTVEPFRYDIFGTIRAGDGKQIVPEQTAVVYRGENDTLIDYEILIPDLKNQKNPISLELTAFPTWITGECKVRIK